MEGLISTGLPRLVWMGIRNFLLDFFYGKAKHPRICPSFPAPAPFPSPSTALASAPATASALSGGQGRLN